MVQPFKERPFNTEVCDALEKLLTRAREGHINFLAFSICKGVSHGEDGYVGDMTCFTTAYYGLMHCANRIMARCEKHSAPGADFAAPANMYRYDVSVEPMCHDFIAWLVTVKMMQAREGVPGPTKICFLRRKDETMLGYIDASERERFYQNVCLPALKLLGCEIDHSARDGRIYPLYTYREITAASDQGEEVPRIKVPDEDLAKMRERLGGVQPVTITLREHRYWMHRNSDIPEWIKFAHWLQAKGERVIFVRDTAKADEPIDGFETMPDASRDLMVRTALYENAKCNCFVSNGPWVWGLFGSRPWLMFVDCRDTEYYIQNTPEWWENSHGITKGQQFPWSGPQQCMVWHPDTCEAMIEAWNQTFETVAEKTEAA